MDYSSFDNPLILSCLFHPRPDYGGGIPTPQHAKNLLIDVEDDVQIGARFHCKDKQSPVILFFHGNGEIVSDYDDLGPVYLEKGVNFLPVDYRGYGRSTGVPTVTNMMKDCHIVFQYVKKWLSDHGFKGPVFIMGRSLGSASALELAHGYESEIHGLIIESGFAYALDLLNTLGINTKALGIKEEKGLGNIDKIRTFNKPVLIIHAENDHIIPFSDGRALYDNCLSPNKKMLMISGANHNTIFEFGLHDYMNAIKEFTEAC
jgi:alpha-beta hydrolase superfamily lysophospholipase